MSNSIKVERCYHYGTVSTASFKLKRCTGSLGAFYCNSTCQRSDRAVQEAVLFAPKGVAPQGRER